MMNSPKLASGDNIASDHVSPRYVDNIRSHIDDADNTSPNENDVGDDTLERGEHITSQTMDDNEVKLKERIAQCKKVIESLKLQLNEEKEKLKNEKKAQHLADTPKYVSKYHHDAMDDYGNTSLYSACVDNKLCCDENLIEYEKQLQKYQNTLNIAQNEKKNAIRRQMLAKAYKLKLMEVENQCNIELLRVKQSIQCLEPLQMIANKWKTNTDESVIDASSFELMPNFLELKATSAGEANSLDLKIAMEHCGHPRDDHVLD